MSVVVPIHFPVSDVAKAIEGLHDNAKFLEEISASTKDAGLIHHRFVSGDGELVVIDEWDTAEQFQSFFGQPGGSRCPHLRFANRLCESARRMGKHSPPSS